MVQGQIWEVVCSSGILVRQGRSINSPPLDQPLSSGSLVQEQECVGDRLLYNRIAGTGYGPDSGWVSIRTRAGDLLVPSDWAAPKQGWTILSAELPSADQLAALQLTDAPPQTGSGSSAKAGPGSAVAPQSAQKPGDPFVFYRQITFLDTKTTGLRMSSCLAAMDDCRTDLFTICDQTVESMRNVTDPFVEVVIELRPEIRKLGQGSSSDGLLYTHPSSRGAVLSWLRAEAKFGWPNFPMRNEEQTLHLLGKSRGSTQSVPLARGRFTECLVDEVRHEALSGAQWEQDVEQFFGKVKSDHSAQMLDTPQLRNLYPTGSGPFKPSQFKLVTWLMSSAYGDLWSVLYHAKAPELLWDLNRLAGGSFAQLVEQEPDPQALSMALPKKMEVGKMYDALCFLEEASKKAVYILLPSGVISEQSYNKECVLAVCANYNWAEAPSDGCSLKSQDLEVLSVAARIALMDFAADKAPKAHRVLDLSGLKRE